MEEFWKSVRIWSEDSEKIMVAHLYVDSGLINCFFRATLYINSNNSDLCETTSAFIGSRDMSCALNFQPLYYLMKSQ